MARSRFTGKSRSSSGPSHSATTNKPQASAPQQAHHSTTPAKPAAPAPAPAAPAAPQQPGMMAQIAANAASTAAGVAIGTF